MSHATTTSLFLAFSDADGSADLPCTEDSIDYILHTVALPHTSEESRTVLAHQGGIATHNVEACANVRCEIGLLLVELPQELTLLMMNKSD